MVSRTVSIELDDLTKVQEKIKEGNVANISELVQKSIKMYLKSLQSD
jgi:Arc/MetJ-type ribon-helix-helix transcriptional regulator